MHAHIKYRRKDGGPFFSNQNQSVFYFLILTLFWGVPQSRAQISPGAINVACEDLKSVYLNSNERIKAINSFINLVRIPGASGQEKNIRLAIKALMEKCGAREQVLNKKTIQAPENLLMVIPASPGMESKPGLMLNAHMDTIAESSPANLRFNKKDSEFYHLYDKDKERVSSFGGDDRTGVACLTECIQILQKNYWSKGVKHRKIILLFTADEERGLIGAKYLAKYHTDIFDNLEWNITMDGPLDFRVKYPEYSIVAVLADSDRERKPYRKTLEITRDYCRRTSQKLALTRLGLGMGDFAAFPEKAKAGLHFRSPVRGLHSNEKVKLQDLINHIDLFCHILLEWDSVVD